MLPSGHFLQWLQWQGFGCSSGLQSMRACLRHLRGMRRLHFRFGFSADIFPHPLNIGQLQTPTLARGGLIQVSELVHLPPEPFQSSPQYSPAVLAHTMQPHSPLTSSLELQSLVSTFGQTMHLPS